METSEAREHFRRVLIRLRDRAMNNQVNWQKGPRESSYFVKFPSSAIELRFDSPETEPDWFAAMLVNDRGTIVKTLTAYEENQEDWALLSRLWIEAERAVTGWDKALADAEKALDDADSVGEIPF